MQNLGLLPCHPKVCMISAAVIIQLLPLISMVYVGSVLLSFQAQHCSLVSCLIARSLTPLSASHVSRHTDTNMAQERTARGWEKEWKALGLWVLFSVEPGVD